MTSNPNELNQAIVLCLGYGSTTSPIFDREKLIEIYGQKDGANLFNDIKAIIDEATQIPIDWSNDDLDVAGKKVHAEMYNRYPYLSNQALDAIAWKFTYDWR